MAALAASPLQRTCKRPQQFLALSGKLGRKYANFLFPSVQIRYTKFWKGSKICIHYLPEGGGTALRNKKNIN